MRLDIIVVSSPYALDPEDDLLYMERSTFSAFVDPSQAMVLLEIWRRQERGDTRTFAEKFGRQDKRLDD